MFAPGSKKDVIGWENIELISDRPFETMLEEFKRLKAEFPDRSGLSFVPWVVA